MKLLIENRHKKDKKVFVVRKDAGNVEKGIQMFNNSTNTGPLGANISGGMGESLVEGAMKDLYMDVEDAGGKDKYIEKTQHLINRLNSKLERTTDEMEYLKIENQIDELTSKLSVVKGNNYTNKKSIIDRNNKQIDKLKRELNVDSNDYPYNWRKYQNRKIDKLQKQNDELKGK